MSKISGGETKPEIIVRKYLFIKGFRYLKNDKRYPGKPDIVLPKYKSIIFVNGCFWHDHKECKSAKLPKTNIEFWSKKIGDNILRDIKNYRLLRQNRWNVIRIWDCELNTAQKRDNRLNQLVNQIK